MEPKNMECSRCGQTVATYDAPQAATGETTGGQWVCLECLDPQEARLFEASRPSPSSWAIASAEQAVAMGLPERAEPWGLVMFETPFGSRTTWAGSAVAVAAMGEHEGAVEGWPRHFDLEALGWPGEHPLAWVQLG